MKKDASHGLGVSINMSSESRRAPDLDTYLSQIDVRESLGGKLLEALVSVAAEDGFISPAEYTRILEAAQELDASHTSEFIALQAIDHPKKIKETFLILGEASKLLKIEERQRLLKISLPLIELQGEKAQSIGKICAKALGLELNSSQLEILRLGSKSPTLMTVTSHSMRRLKGRDVIARARESLRLCGDPLLSRMISGYLDGNVTLEEVDRQRQLSMDRFIDELSQIKLICDSSDDDLLNRQKILSLAKELVDQLQQRVSIFTARIQLEKDEFTDEFEDLIHDAGNSFELQVRERMDESNWKISNFWNGVAKGPFSRELERRIDRVNRRHSERIRHLKQEAIHFSKEYQIASGRLRTQIHHTAFKRLMPELRLKTKVMSAVDTASDVAVGGSVIAGVGAGTAVYFFGASAVLPVIAPAVPFVAGALLVGLVVKSLTDPKIRGDEEVAHKREAFEGALRKELGRQMATLFAEYDAVQSEFIKTAQAIAGPTMIEAQSQLEVVALQQRIASRILKEAQAALSN